MKERPIIFSAPMVRTLLDGSKTQTRRVVKPQPSIVHAIYDDASISTNLIFRKGDQRIHCPYGQVGGKIWVRETHAQVLEVDIPAGRYAGPIGTAGSPARPDWKSRYVYRADGEMPSVQWHHIGDSQPVWWSASIHMPRRASRITLEILSVRVERLQDISGVDAGAEGAPSSECYGPDCPAGADDCNARGCYGAREWYRELWESINGAGSWDENPFCWVIEFRRVEQ